MKAKIIVLCLILFGTDIHISLIDKLYIHAPELVSGTMYRVDTGNCALGYVRGGYMDFIMLGCGGDRERGFIKRVLGEHTDNNDAPVYYEIVQLKNDRAKGHIEYRGHDRKLCYATEEKKLPCY